MKKNLPSQPGKVAQKKQIVHLVEDQVNTNCGKKITEVVPYYRFSESPCPDCIKRRMSKE